MSEEQVKAMRCMKITCEDEDSDSDGGDMVDNYRLRRQISWMNQILTRINKPFSFLSYISTPSPGLPALLAVVLSESPAKKGVILHRSLEKGPLSKESCFKLQASRWRTYFRKWCTMESFNMAPFLIHPSLDFNHLSFRNVFNRSQ